MNKTLAGADLDTVRRPQFDQHAASAAIAGKYASALAWLVASGRSYPTDNPSQERDLSIQARDVVLAEYGFDDQNGS